MHGTSKEIMVEEKARVKRKRKSAFSKALQTFLDGSYLVKDKLSSWIPFAIFLTLLGLIYIRINYQAVHVEQEILRLRKELHELQFDYVQMKTRINLMTQPTVLEKDLTAYGIKRLQQPPQKIFLQKHTQSQ